MQADNGILQRELQRMRLEMAQIGQATGVSISAEAPELQNLSSMRSREVGSHIFFLLSLLHLHMSIWQEVMPYHPAAEVSLRCVSNPIRNGRYTSCMPQMTKSFNGFRMHPASHTHLPKCPCRNGM